MLLLRHRGGFLNPAPPPLFGRRCCSETVCETPSAVLFPGRGLFCGDAGGMPGLPAIDETRNSMLRCLGCRNKRIRRRLNHGREGMAARRGTPFGHSWRVPRSIRRSGTGETLKECGDAGRRGLLCKRGRRRAGCSAYRTLSHQHARSGDIAAHSSHACEYEPHSTDCT